MTTASLPMPQLRVDQVSLVPKLFRAIQPQTVGLATEHDNYLLRDISFEVSGGDRIAIVGPSGAGKTMLLRLLNRLSEPTSGTLYLNNQPYAKIPVVQLRQQVVLVLQESKLLGMTVQETLAYPLQLRGLPQKQIQQRVGDWIEQLHLPQDWLNRTEHQLSVGQRQLVAIARALIIEPPILLLDEPTSALDLGRSQEVFHLLSDLAITRGTTILMVNHQLEWGKDFSTRLLYLQKGNLLQDQPSSQIDWSTLKQQLQQAETQQAEEWT